ncbi:hypothetical protein ACFFV7_19160 [Nonomuraea spiralis]|uniref:Uncharacterized protein n=1 Tax=Nonomuraea spiralis TaxID=46182 RepID=A0ABV5IFK9_9ACTN|nr:hypothetical protein [Nonomuraea spiralis]GGS72049.1 hypothetical protein GCM10010176_013860 [Nonomuraea spiralis]
MGWTLETPEGGRIDVNAWNRRPALALLEDFCRAAPDGFTCA